MSQVEPEKVVKVSREYPLGCGCLTKAILTLGLYILWWAAKSLTVTNKRVVWKTGVLGKSEKTIPLSRVTDVSVSSSMFGRMLGYGDIRIESAGGPGTEIVAEGISKPGEVRDAIIF